MKKNGIKKIIIAGVSILCLSVLFTGCKKKTDHVSEPPGQKMEGETKEQEESRTSTSQEETTELQKESTASGGRQLYQDQHLSYEIPESWAKNEEESSDSMMFAFFQSQDPETEYPSNVNVQITQLNTGAGQEGIDYGSKEIQEEFHQFLIGDMGLPAEAASGTFSVTQTGKGVYVYSLGFERRAMDGIMVHQTIYLPMNLEHSIVIWATDFQEGARVSADEAALGICETLTINASGKSGSEHSGANSGETSANLVFEGHDLEGNVISSDILSSAKLTMINVWATYCNPCLREMPGLGELASAYSAEEFQLIGIISDVQEGADQKMLDLASDLVERTGADYPHLLLNASLHSALLKDVSAVPTTFFIDSEGNILDTVVGSMEKEEWEEKINAILETQ